MQSWGSRSRWNRRDTGRVPTLSAVAGMLAAAQGHPRGVPPTWVEGMGLAVRSDRPGAQVTDYHTANASYPYRPDGGKARKSGGGIRKDMVITYRDYLTDAAFTVIATHPDPAVVASWALALAEPRWAPYLGRRSCPPSLPVLVGGTDRDPEELLRDKLPLLVDPPQGRTTIRVTCTASSSDPDSWTDDLPVATDPTNRQFSPRGIREHVWEIHAERCAGTGTTGWAAIHHSLHEESNTP